MTGTCILTERVGSVQDAGFFTGGKLQIDAAKSISGDGSDGSEDPKGALWCSGCGCNEGQAMIK